MLKDRGRVKIDVLNAGTCIMYKQGVSRRQNVHFVQMWAECRPETVGQTCLKCHSVTPVN